MVVVAAPDGVTETSTSPALSPLSACSWATPEIVSVMVVARPVSMRAATTAASWEPVIWAWLAWSTCSWLRLEGQTDSRSRISSSSSSHAPTRSTRWTG